jgi:TolB-like protein/DNA-binding winged helix-turn-helix (wHTH) protein/Tfp pilus assembly protein PilF
MARYLRDEFCVYQVADLRIDVGRRSVMRGDVDIQLPKLSFDLLLTLVQAAPNVVTTEDFMEQVWPDLVVGSETVVQRVKLLRDALGDDPRNPTYLAGVRGFGYRLIPSVSRLPTVSLEGVPTPAPTAAPAIEARALPASAMMTPEMPGPPPHRWAFRIVAVLVVAGCALAGGIYIKSRTPTASEHPAGTSQIHAGQVAVIGAPIRTVAVMPFEDLSLARDNGQLALAVPEMVLQRLGMVNDLIVIARSSSFAFLGKQVDAREVGSRLDARYLVEGALQRVGDRLRVTAQLIDARSGTQLKSLQFDRGIGDIFSLQDEIAGQLATALQVQLLSADMKRVDRSRGTSLDAYMSYLNSQVLLNRWTVKDAEKAAVELQHAIDLDPKFALAYAELARARYISFFLRRGYSKNEQLPDLLALTNKALQLDPQLGEALAIRASLEVDTDLAAADADYRKGISLAPNYGPAYEMYAESLADNFNRPDEGLAMIERAILIDPVAPRNIYYKGLYLEGQNKDLAEQAFKRALEVGPDYPPAYVRLAINRWGEGKTAEAIRLIENALRVETLSTWINVNAVAMYLDIGDRQAASSVAKNAPSDTDVTLMIAVYDRQYEKVPHYDLRYEFGVNVPEYAYWVSLEHRSIQQGTLEAAIGEVRAKLNFKNAGEGYVPREDDFVSLLGLAGLLKLNGNRAPPNLLAAIQKLMDQMGALPGHLQAAVDLLRDNPRAALAHLSADVHQAHWNMLWVMERDPIYDTVRTDPAYLELVELENSRMANQRRLLEDMRASGQVPRR